MEETIEAGVRRIPVAPLNYDAPQITGLANRQTGLSGIKGLINRFGHQLPGLETQRTILAPALPQIDLQPKFQASESLSSRHHLLSEEVLPAPDLRDSPVGRSVARLLKALNKTPMDLHPDNQ